MMMSFASFALTSLGDPKERATAMANRMTLDEQLLMLHGTPGGAECTTHPSCAVCKHSGCHTRSLLSDSAARV